MLLIFPPVAKPCEPPAGVALLSAALKEHDIDCRVYDANIEGLLYLIQSDPVFSDQAQFDPVREDSWARRALKNRDTLLKDIGDPNLYTNVDRYHQRVYDLNKLLDVASTQWARTLGYEGNRFRITLGDYSDRQLSALDSKDLLASADDFRSNPFYPFFEDRLRPKIETWTSEYVGISLCYLNQALVSFALAGWIRANFPARKLVLGGGLVSSWMARPDFNDPFTGLIDVMIKGEGEQPLLELLGVAGIRKKHYVPDYEFAKDHAYMAPGTILPFRASIGCYWSKCRFCPEKAETRPYATQRAAKVVEDVRQMSRAFSPDTVHFIDNAMTPAFLRALSTQTFDFKWYGFVRFEKDFTDPVFCRNLKKSGCNMLKLGLESGDQDVLDRMGKGTCLETVSKTLKNLHQAGIFTFVYLLFGTSFEDEAGAHRTLEYVKANKQYIDYLNLAVFNLPKFSQDAQDLDTREFYQGDLSLYLNFEHPSGWDRRKVKQFLDKQFKKELAIGSEFRKNPAFFSSNHAMFFNQTRGQVEIRVKPKESNQ